MPWIGGVNVFVEHGTPSFERRPVTEYADHFVQIERCHLKYFPIIHFVGFDDTGLGVAHCPDDDVKARLLLFADWWHC